MALLYFFIFVAGGVALDWALYSRIVTALGRPGFYGDGDGYTKFLFPRIVFTLAAIIILFFVISGVGTNVALLLGGAGGFLISPCYAAYRYLAGH